MKWLQKYNILIVILFLVVLIIGNVSAITAKIGNARVVLYPELNKIGKTTIDRTIKVINDNDVVVNVTLHVSQELKDIVKIIDKELILQPDEERDAKFQIILSKEGKYDGTINVLFTEFGGKEGVVLASRLIIYASKGGSNGNIDNEEDEFVDELESETNPEIIENVREKIPPIFVMLIFTTLIAVIALIYLFNLMNKRRVLEGRNNIEVKTSKFKKKSPQNEK